MKRIIALSLLILLSVSLMTGCTESNNDKETQSVQLEKEMEQRKRAYEVQSLDEKSDYPVTSNNF